MGFLRWLFGSAAQSGDGLNRALIAAATERAVGGTDPRLRALSNYREKLRDPVARAVAHVIELVDAFPAPAEITRDAFGHDPCVRAFFSSAEHLEEILGRSKSLRDYLNGCSGAPPDQIFGMLAMEREERTVFGMELEGDAIRRDVMQVAVSFFNHRFLAPAASEADTRWELKKRAFDFLIERALERLTAERKKRGELEHQRCLLRRKLEAMRAGDWGLSAMLNAPERQAPSDIPALEAEIESIDAELGRFGTSTLSLEQSLAEIADTLGRPAGWLQSRQICLRLDYRGIKRMDSSAAPSQEIELTELFSGIAVRRIVLLGRVPRREIPAQPDFLKKAGHYLA